MGLEERLKRARPGEEEAASLVLMLMPRGEAIGDDEIAIVGASKCVCDTFRYKDIIKIKKALNINRVP